MYVTLTDSLLAHDLIPSPHPHAPLHMQAIFSRNNGSPAVGVERQNPSREDQFFTLVHGTGSRQGLYAIRSKATNNVLFSRTHAEPFIGHTPAAGYDAT